jgi:hypothetical protein
MISQRLLPYNDRRVLLAVLNRAAVDFVTDKAWSWVLPELPLALVAKARWMRTEAAADAARAVARNAVSFHVATDARRQIALRLARVFASPIAAPGVEPARFAHA